jgi:sugar phosphate isomerase/epimerase
MKVGMDELPLSTLFKEGPLELLDRAAAYGFEGLMCSSRPLAADESYRQQVIEKARAHNLYLELGGGGIDTALYGRSTEELVGRWKPLFPVAVEAGSRVLNTGLGTWPWEGRVMQEPGKSVEDQIQGGIATLRALAPMAEDYGVAVTIHTAFFTAQEHVRMMEEVDSPYVGLCLDTANAFLVLEDPVDFARQVAPWVKSTHLKDSCIYLHEGGMDWLGGSPLGRGTVDLAAIVDIVYQADPDCNLSIEDHWGRMTMSIYDPAFLASFPDWNGEQLAKLFRHLAKGEGLLRAGMYPTAEEAKNIDWESVFPERERANAGYAKKLRDQAAAGGPSTSQSK